MTGRWSPVFFSFLMTHKLVFQLLNQINTFHESSQPHCDQIDFPSCQAQVSNHLQGHKIHSHEWTWFHSYQHRPIFDLNDRSLQVNKGQINSYLEKRPLERSLLLAALGILSSSWHVLDLTHGEHLCFRVKWGQIGWIKVIQYDLYPLLVGPFIENPPSK